MNPRQAGGVIALIVVSVDQIAKMGVLSRSDQFAVDSRPLAPFLDLTLRWNRGISFSLFAGDYPSGQTTLLVLTFAAITLLAWWLHSISIRAARRSAWLDHRRRSRQRH